MGTQNTNSVNEHISGDSIDLYHYFGIINKYKWRIVFLALFVSIIATFVVYNSTPVYSSTATLLIEANQAKAVSFDEIVGRDSNKKEYYLTQFEIIKSRTLAREVVNQLNLKDHPEFISKESYIDSIIQSVIDLIIPYLPFRHQESQSNHLTQENIDRMEEIEIQQLIKIFSERLSIEPVQKTQLVNISYESSDPKLTSSVANAVGETYINMNLRAKMGINQEASGWLNNRLSDLLVRLQTSEERLQNYRENENLIDISGVLGLITKELEQTSTQLVVARNESNKLQSIIRVINEYGRNNIKKLESLTEITSHNVIQDIKRTLVQAKLKVSELSNVYGSKHPKMISARSELSTVEKNFSEQVNQLVSGIEKELKTNTRNVAALEKELSEIRIRHQQINRKSYEYYKLIRDVETNRSIYDTLLSRMKETEVTSDFNSAVARFSDRASEPYEPIKPNKRLIIFIAFITTLGLGITIAFLVDSLDDTLQSSEDVENKLAMRVLGILPFVDLDKYAEITAHMFFDKKHQKFAEAMRTIRTSLGLTQIGKKVNVITVTSAVPGEGKTTVALNLAISLGQINKTILIDADMRKPSISKRFDIPAYHPGLANIIAGTEDFNESIFFDRKSRIAIMPSGQLPTNPLELLSSEQFARTLDLLKEKYTNIIIDTAPIGAVSDSLVVAQQSDAIVYVVKSNDTRIVQVQDSIKRLITTRVKIAGVILNQVPVNKGTSKELYNGYYSSYSYGSDSAISENTTHHNIQSENDNVANSFDADNDKLKSVIPKSNIVASRNVKAIKNSTYSIDENDDERLVPPPVSRKF